MSDAIRHRPEMNNLVVEFDSWDTKGPLNSFVAAKIQRSYQKRDINSEEC